MSPPLRNKLSWIAALLGLAILGGFVFVVRTYVPDGDHLIALLNSLGAIPLPYYIGVYTLATLMMLPLSLMNISAGVILGTAGIPMMILGAVIGSTISFALGRGVLNDLARQVVDGRPGLKGLQKALETDGFRLVALLRMSPVFPFGIFNYAAGVIPIALPAFSLATLIGLTPRITMGVLIAAGGREILEAGSEASLSWEQIVGYTFGFCATVGVTIVLSKLSKRALAMAELEGSEGNDPQEKRTGSDEA